MQRTLTRTTLKLGAIADRVARRRLLLQFSFGIVAFVLGFWGWTIKTPPSDWNDWANNFFRTIQLITLHFPTEFDGHLPWQLQLGRLAVPLIAFVASLNVVLGAITRPVRLALLPTVADHVVFVGAPKLTDGATARLIGEGHHLVFVHPQIEGSRLDVLEGLGVTVVAMDPLQTPILADLNLAAARAVFVATGNDVDNANLSVMIAEQVKGRSASRARLVLAVEFEREDLARELIRVVDDTGKAAPIRFVRLSPDREGLELELQSHAPTFSARRRDDVAHVLFVGLVGSWEQSLSRLIVALQDRPDETPLVTMVLDPSEEERFKNWRSERPDLGVVVRFDVVAKGFELLPVPMFSGEKMGGRFPPQLMIVMREDAEGLATAFAARHADSGIPRDIPVLLRQSREDRLLRLISGGPDAQQRGEGPLVPFGGLLRDESVRRLLDRAGDRTAIALHAAYLREAGGSGIDKRTVLEEWETLPETFREANRSSAAHVRVFLSAIGKSPASFVAADSRSLTADEWLRLAKIEHRRWCADRIDRGWRQGAVRDDAERIHPCIVEWDLLSQLERAKDGNAVRTLLALPP